MRAYSRAYLQEVVETQGKLFDRVTEYEPGIDVRDFIRQYMDSRTRRHIDHGQVYVCTLNSRELWIYFLTHDNYKFCKGDPIRGFRADWIGQFYAYFQWYYNMPSKKVFEKVSLDFMEKAYHGLHDLELDLAVRKVGEKVVK